MVTFIVIVVLFGLLLGGRTIFSVLRNGCLFTIISFALLSWLIIYLLLGRH